MPYERLLCDWSGSKIKSSYFRITLESMLANYVSYIVTLYDSLSVSITASFFPACQSYKYQESTDQPTSLNKWIRLAINQKTWYNDRTNNFRTQSVSVSNISCYQQCEWVSLTNTYFKTYFWTQICYWILFSWINFFFSVSVESSLVRSNPGWWSLWKVPTKSSILWTIVLRSQQCWYSQGPHLSCYWTPLTVSCETSIILWYPA